VGLFATKILTFDQIIVDIPNSQILGSKIINLSRSPYRNCQ
jgi:small-conductance mechanosensitive channel